MENFGGAKGDCSISVCICIMHHGDAEWEIASCRWSRHEAAEWGRSLPALYPISESAPPHPHPGSFFWRLWAPTLQREWKPFFKILESPQDLSWAQYCSCYIHSPSVVSPVSMEWLSIAMLMTWTSTWTQTQPAVLLRHFHLHHRYPDQTS